MSIINQNYYIILFLDINLGYLVFYDIKILE